jgi:hypothetical protein
MIQITKIMEAAQPFQSHPAEQILIDSLLELLDAHHYAADDRRLALAAAFDLVVAADYYRSVGHIGWLYCSQPTPHLFYPYTNTCPQCVLDGHFEYHKAHKPRSGAIGATTARLLGVFIQSVFQRREKPIRLLKAFEPIDMLLVDDTTTPITVFCAEVKASPLVTLPLAVYSQLMVSESDEI